MFKKLLAVAFAILATLMIVSCQQPNNDMPAPPKAEDLPPLTDFRGIPSEYFYPDYDSSGEPDTYYSGRINLKAVKGTGRGDQLRENSGYIYETANQVMLLQRHPVNYSEEYGKNLTDGYFLCTYIKSDAFDTIHKLINNTTPILAYYLVPSMQGQYSYITKGGEFGGSSDYIEQVGYYSFDYESLRRGITKIEQVLKIEFKEDGSFDMTDITDKPEAQAYLGWIIPDHNEIQQGESTFSFRTDTDNIFLIPNVYSKYCVADLKKNAKVDSPVGAVFDKAKHGLMSEIGEKASVIAAYKWKVQAQGTSELYKVSNIAIVKSNIIPKEPTPIE